MVSGRIKASAAVGGLFVGIVGIGAYAIVSLAPVTEPVPPPRGTFLQDAGPGIAHAQVPQDGDLPSDALPPAHHRPTTAAARPARPVQNPAPGADRIGPVEEAPAGSLRSKRLADAPPAIAPRPPAPRPSPKPRPEDSRLANVLTPSEIRKLKLSLRLTPEQAPHWPPVEAVLSEIGAQQMMLARSGQNTADAFSSQTSMRIYWAAKPLLGLMREDQKAQIRVRARAMGLEAVASYL